MVCIRKLIPKLSFPHGKDKILTPNYKSTMKCLPSLKFGAYPKEKALAIRMA